MMRVALLAAALLVAASPAFAEDDGCDRNNQSQMAMNQCAGVDAANADAALNKIYKQLAAKLDGKEKTALRDAQRAWIAFRDFVERTEDLPVGFLVKNGSSRYWLALVVLNTGNAIASVQLETSPGHWMKLTHVNWNAWIAQQGAGPGPFTVRVTDVLRHQVTIHGVALKPNTVQRTRTWMYGKH